MTAFNTFDILSLQFKKRVKHFIISSLSKNISQHFAKEVYLTKVSIDKGRLRNRGTELLLTQSREIMKN